ncbi:mannosyltransferase putative-domain-containing protein [Cladorrhinum samala]|uniref:Mannosyltransferase putative-domain-containing protein n=1 Tax=Cladorrhinum samala TaxID=585594 RepID=A0AAV9HCV7_9PEZI|nr:mannosyltransferase putative-domain-containing protein [Cladorrhinum samala]
MAVISNYCTFAPHPRRPATPRDAPRRPETPRDSPRQPATPGGAPGHNRTASMFRPSLPHAGNGKVLFILFVPFVVYVFFLFQSGLRARISLGLQRQDAPSIPSDKPANDWWVEFFTRFEKTRPKIKPLEFKGGAQAVNWKPDIDQAREEIIQLSDSDLAELRESHSNFIAQLASFARRLPYAAGTTGMVTAAGSKNFGQAISVVLVARRAGSQLPVEIVVDSTDPWIDQLCVGKLRDLNVTCVYLNELWTGLDPLLPEFRGFQWKFIAMIASSFQNVLYLDADALPILNPDPIFAPGAEPYASTGLITWPDFWASSSSPYFYQIAGDLPVPPLTARATSESGIMIFDKRRHGDTILLASYYNYNGFSHYYPLLSQHGPGEGDKETFLHAAFVLEGLRQKGQYHEPTKWMTPDAGVKKGWWDVKKMPVAHGRSIKEKWNGAFMQQMDPVEDYRVVMQALHETQKGKGSGPWARGEMPPRHPRRQPIDTAHFHTNSTFLDTVGNLTLEHNNGRYMFFHHNGIKPDFARITESKTNILATDDGKYVRMWGHPGWVIERTGRDVEKDLWLDSQKIYCEYTSLNESCEAITKAANNFDGRSRRTNGSKARYLGRVVGRTLFNTLTFDDLETDTQD